MPSHTLRRWDPGHLRRPPPVLIVAENVSIAFVSPTPEAQKTRSTPKLWLDATKSEAYSGTVSTWTDLSPNQNCLPDCPVNRSTKAL
jgi:hypothetical protein